jgi:hypothetical protein
LTGFLHFLYFVLGVVVGWLLCSRGHEALEAIHDAVDDYIDGGDDAVHDALQDGA